MQFERRIRRTRQGEFELRIPDQEREILAGLPARLRELLGSDDPAVGRLFPPAYEDDPVRQADYETVVRGDLTAQRLRSLEVMEETLRADRLDEEQLTAWLGALNDLRLVLGTKLDVDEDMDPDDIPETDDQAPAYALYYYLGWLEEQIVTELAAGLDPGGTE
ncbi:MAG: DUF2017 domain-containing protein [Actinomycetota bacterium]|nr:DUF2017 domain-containing protein [Actinomycetota bacterium]